MWSKCAHVTPAVSLVLATWKLLKKYVTSIFDSNLFIKTKKVSVRFGCLRHFIWTISWASIKVSSKAKFSYLLMTLTLNGEKGFLNECMFVSECFRICRVIFCRMACKYYATITLQCTFRKSSGIVNQNISSFKNIFEVMQQTYHFIKNNYFII